MEFAPYWAKHKKEGYMPCKKQRLISLFLFVFLSLPAFSNSLMLSGLGARAVAMGGAYVGLSDDFSAVYWNPAAIGFIKQRGFGITGMDLKPSVSYEYNAVMGANYYSMWGDPKHSNYFPILPSPFRKEPVDGGVAVDIAADSLVNDIFSGLIAYHQPISDKLTAGIGVYAPARFATEWSGAAMSDATLRRSDFDWSSRFDMLTIAPVLAWRAHEMVSFGVGLNINHAVFKLSHPYGGEGFGVGLGQYGESLSGWALGATFSILCKPNEQVTGGITYRIPFKLRLKGDAGFPNIPDLGNSDPSLYAGLDLAPESGIEREIPWPMWLGVGVSLKASEALTFSFDVHYTRWSRMTMFEAEFAQPAWSRLMMETEADRTVLDWEDMAVFRVGAEYMIKHLAVRAGFYYDQSPSNTDTINLFWPTFSTSGLTAGLGYSLNGFSIDLGLEYLAAPQRQLCAAKKRNDINYAYGMPGTYRMHGVIPRLSVAYRF